VSEKPPESVAAKRVIVAEDESFIRIDIVETLRDHGFEVIAEAADGEKAVALAEELRPDLVVMDVKMPLMDGISAAEILTKKKIAPWYCSPPFHSENLWSAPARRAPWPTW
jgi:CheY-like chemotaxis protein